MDELTTIQISKDLLDVLKKRKLSEKESYERVIWDLIEDTLEISEQTKKEIEESRLQIKAGKHITHDRLKTEIGAY